MDRRRAAKLSVLQSITLFLILGLTASVVVARDISMRSLSSSARPPRPAIAFKDATRANHISLSKFPTWGSVWVDSDRDGVVELIINRHKRHAFLFDNLGGGYRQRRVPVFERPAPGRNYYDRHACSWGEANGDGLPDLYCVAGAQKGEGVGANQLLIQTPTGLVDKAEEYGLVDPSGRGRTVNWLDYDGDGDLDIFVGNELRAGSPNAMYRNDDGFFTKTKVGVEESLATSNSTWADWDNDGDPDLVVFAHGYRGAQVYRNEGGSYRQAFIPGISGRAWDSAAWADYDGDGWVDLHLVSRWRSLVLRNVGGTFQAAHQTALVSGRMSTWLDVENDGDLDLFIVTGAPKPRWRAEGNHPDVLLRQDNGEFRQVVRTELRGPADGSGDSVAAADYDGDGATDLFITNGYLDNKGRVQLMRNDSKMQNWAGLMLLGELKDPFGFGARVEVVSEHLKYERTQTDNFNFKVQGSAGYLHLGLQEDEVAKVRVTWRDGTQDCISVRSGLVFRVIKGSVPCLP